MLFDFLQLTPPPKQEGKTKRPTKAKAPKIPKLKRPTVTPWRYTMTVLSGRFLGLSLSVIDGCISYRGLVDIGIPQFESSCLAVFIGVLQASVALALTSGYDIGAGFQVRFFSDKGIIACPWPPATACHYSKSGTPNILYKKQSVAPTTYKNWYGKMTRRFEKMPYWIETSQGFIDWLAQPQPSNQGKPWSNDTQRRSLQQMKAATAWAKKTKLRARDPFAEIDNYTKPRRKEPPQAYTAQERKIIMNSANTLNPRHRRWIHALFLNGARPSELRALKRHHWASDGSILQFISA